MKRLHRDQTGFTLIELLVAIPIAALVVTAATGAIFQILNSTQARNDMIAYRQVQTAGYWVSHDTLQAQNVTPGTNAGFPLTLTWTDWDDSEVHQVVYSLQGMGTLKQLQRQESVNGVPTATTPAGEYIYVATDPTEPTNCVWDEDGKVLTFTVKAQVEQQTATRTYEIKPRPL